MPIIQMCKCDGCRVATEPWPVNGDENTPLPRGWHSIANGKHTHLLCGECSLLAHLPALAMDGAWLRLFKK